jgi:DNA-binding transcriptional ArsR family regulator
MNLRETSPHHLSALDVAELRRLVLEFCEEHEPDEVDARRLDHVLRTKVLDALRHASDPSVLTTLHDDLARALPKRLRRQLPPAWDARWRGITDLLQTRIGQLQSLDAEAVLHRPLAQELLRALGDGDCSQQELVRQLDTSKATVSRLVAVLEDHGLVERIAVGREKRVRRVRPAADEASSIAGRPFLGLLTA